MILDTDLGDDIDDAFALAVCLNHPGLDLRGVTTVRGDTGLRAAQARYLLALGGRPDLPVAAGSRDALDGIVPLNRNCQAEVLPTHEEERWREGRTDAVRMLAELSTENPGALLLCIGPLTNAARLIVEFPEAFSQLNRVVVMGGHLLDLQEQPEYNFACDPRAAQVVIDCGKPLLVVGLEVTMQCQMSEEQVAELGQGEAALAAAVAEMTHLWQKNSEPKRLPVLHDPLAALALAEPDIIATESLCLQIDEQGGCHRAEGEPQVEYAVEVEAARVTKQVVTLVR